MKKELFNIWKIPREILIQIVRQNYNIKGDVDITLSHKGMTVTKLEGTER